MARRKSSPCKRVKNPPDIKQPAIPANDGCLLIELPVEVVEDAGNSLVLKDASGNTICTRINDASDNDDVDWEIMEAIAAALNASHYDV